MHLCKTEMTALGMETNNAFLVQPIYHGYVETCLFLF